MSKGFDEFPDDPTPPELVVDSDRPGAYKDPAIANALLESEHCLVCAMSRGELASRIMRIEAALDRLCKLIDTLKKGENE